MAHTKQGGSSDYGRDSAGKRLGVKKNHGESVLPGQIIIRQRGTHFYDGSNVKRGSDDTLYSLKKGVVKFSSKQKTNYNGTKKRIKVVSVVEDKK